MTHVQQLVSALTPVHSQVLSVDSIYYPGVIEYLAECVKGEDFKCGYVIFNAYSIHAPKNKQIH